MENPNLPVVIDEPSLPVISDEMTLSELVVAYNRLSELIATTGGELTPELEETLSRVDLTTGRKLDAYKFVMDRLCAESEFWCAEAAKRTKIAKACDKIANRMKASVMTALSAMGVKKLEGETVTATLSPTKGRVEVDLKTLPKEYQKQETVWVADKDKIRADLERFVEIPGAKLEGGLSVRFTTRRKGG